MNSKIKKFISRLTPLAFKQTLHTIKDLRLVNNGSAEIVYSQQGEDLAINRFFPDLNRGFYIDIGAFHPIKYSNTYKLYQRGWRGINIEPNPDQTSQFFQHRNEDINLNIGVSAAGAVLKYYSFNKPAVNTFVEANAVEWSKVEGFKIKEVKQVTTLPLATILEKYIAPGKNIDLMNIDVEGMDIEVLRSNDWKRFRPSLLLVEEMWHEKESIKDAEVYKFLCSQDYELWNIVGITMFFADKKYRQVQDATKKGVK